jgi:serine/threonine protein kinase
MSARSVDTHHSRTARRRDWTARTVDLDTTADIDGDSSTTSDLRSVITHDFIVEPVPSIVNGAIVRSTPEPRTLDLAPMPSAVANDDRSAPAPARTATDLAPGGVLCDRYLLEELIGSGGTAIVFRARDMQSSGGSAPNVQVAIKTPRPELQDRERAIARLQHEFKCMHRLDHPNVVKVFDIQNAADTWFMTLELVDGKPLAALLRNGSMLTKALTRQVLNDCADALAHAHSRGVVHGDFKPANVFVGRANTVKVLDFGAAYSPATSDSRIPAGTPAYASPEVLSGLDPEPRDDVFSFACVAYEMLTGRHPYERRSSIDARAAESVPARAWNLSAQQWLALLAALSLDREQRPADIRALADVLQKEPQVPPEELLVKADPSIAPLHEPLPDDILPPQRSWGFFVFIAVAIAMVFIALQHKSDVNDDAQPNPPAAIVTPAATPPPPTDVATTPATSAQQIAVTDSEKKSAAESGAGTPRTVVTHAEPHRGKILATAPQSAPTKDASAASPTKSTTPARYATDVGFESGKIVTSERSIAAVFVLKRTGSLRERVSVHWNAVSQTAQNGEDFIAGNGGTVDFAAGQSQRAIYVPLRNDTLAEGDETFAIRITSAQRANIGEIAKVEATIQDDD